MTLQTFAVVLMGVVLGWKQGLLATLIYILIGAMGVPVFSGFQAGIGVLVGKTGGFLWGFLFLVSLAGIGGRLKMKHIGVLAGMLGLFLCHLLGILQFLVVAGVNGKTSFFMVSFPYLLKDIVSVIIAYVVGWQVRRLMLRAAILTH